MRRAGPERSDQKNTNKGRRSSLTTLLLSDAESGVGVLFALKTPRPNAQPNIFSGYRALYTPSTMGDWYTIGLTLGLGVAIGVFFAGLLSATPLGRLAGVVLAVLVGAAAGVLVEDWAEIGAGAAGGLAGASATAIVVGGALRRGATRGGLALIVAAVAVGLAALAFVPVMGYLVAVGLPAVAARLRRTQGERYAGLRTLAKD